MSKTLDANLDLLRGRERAGIDEYGTDCDRRDLSPLEWCVHLREELADGLMYSHRIHEMLQLLDAAYELLRENEFRNRQGRLDSAAWRRLYEMQRAPNG